MLLSSLLSLSLSAPASAETHGYLGIGPSLLATGARGDSLRYTLSSELLTSRGLGGGLALHSIGGPDRHGVAALRFSMQAAASPPRLWLRLHVELGLALDDHHPMGGAGLTATLRLLGPASLVFDGNAHLLLDGVDGTRLALSVATLAALAW